MTPRTGPLPAAFEANTWRVGVRGNFFTLRRFDSRAFTRGCLLMWPGACPPKPSKARSSHGASAVAVVHLRRGRHFSVLRL
jgi:hypothetical protein